MIGFHDNIDTLCDISVCLFIYFVIMWWEYWLMNRKALRSK